MCWGGGGVKECVCVGGGVVLCSCLFRTWYLAVSYLMFE